MAWLAGETRRYRVALGAAVLASVVYLGWLTSGLGGQDRIQAGANLATLAAALLASLACGHAAVISSGRTRRGWALLAAACGSWAGGQAVWLWYEQIVHRDVPLPSAADIGYLGFAPFAVAAMLAFPAQDARLASRLRTLLDGCITAAALLYASWALVLGPAFQADTTSVAEKVIVLAYPVSDVVIATIVFVVLGVRRRGHVPVAVLGGALLSLTVADTALAYYSQQGTYHTGFVTDAGWVAAFLLVAAAALHPPRAGVPRAEKVAPARALLPYLPLALAVVTSAALQLLDRTAGPFLYWCFAILVVLVFGRQLLTMLDNQKLNRQLAGMLGKLEYQAFHDRLTALPNRALFHDRVEQALARRRREPTPIALLFIDLDDFKDINDGLGHAAGDELLVAVAQRLRDCVRAEDTVARLGGDEFAILLEQATDEPAATAVAARVVQSMQAAFPLADGIVQVTASVGVTVSRDLDLDTVVRQADVAMYTAKAHGKSRFELAANATPVPVEKC
jgi:diguanylate cyclase (GGDEF)-like protein